MADTSRKDKDMRKRTENFYNEVSDVFSRTRQYPWDDLFFIGTYVHKGDRVLDLGCGNGRLVRQLPFDPSTYKGVDISEELIAIARKENPDHDFQKIDTEGVLPLSDASFDVVVSIAVLHHLTPRMAHQMLTEARRVLRPGGVLIVTAWDLWNKKRMPFLLHTWLRGKLGLAADLPFRADSETYMRPCYWWRKGSLLRVAKGAGFSIVEEGLTRGKKGERRNIFIVARRTA